MVTQQSVTCCAKYVIIAYMTKQAAAFLDTDVDAPLGPYDGQPDEEALWFLRSLADEEDDRPPQPDALLARHPRVVDASTWREAEMALTGELAELAFDLGRLSERLAVMGQGAVQRLAHAEASGLSWWTGDRVAAERLALWLSYRIGAVGEDGGGLIRTAWAARRLMAAAPTRQGDMADRIALALGEDLATEAGLAAEVAAALRALDGMQAVTRGCAAFHLWKRLDERPDHLRGLEGAVLGARLAAGVSAGQGRGRALLPFLPLSLTGFAALTAAGPPDRCLAGWAQGAHQAVLSALLLLDRLALWHQRAVAATADLSGRTPLRLLDCLLAHPMVAAPLAEQETGASRAAVQRNLDLLTQRGLVREATGQGRFRVWLAQV